MEKQPKGFFPGGCFLNIIVNRMNVRKNLRCLHLGIRFYNVKAIIFAPDTIKELLVAQSFLSKLRHMQPNAQIDVMAPRSSFALLKYMPYVDHLLKVPFTERSLSLRCRLRAVKLLRQYAYDYAFVLTDSWWSAWVAYFSGVPVRIGRRSRYRQNLFNEPLPPKIGISLEQSYLDFATIAELRLKSEEGAISEGDNGNEQGLVLQEPQTFVQASTQAVKRDIPIVLFESSSDIEKDQWLASCVPYYLDRRISVHVLLKPVDAALSEVVSEKSLLFLACDECKNYDTLQVVRFPSLPKKLGFIKNADLVVSDNIETVLISRSLGKEVIYCGNETLSHWVECPQGIAHTLTQEQTIEQISRRLAACILSLNS